MTDPHPPSVRDLEDWPVLPAPPRRLAQAGVVLHVAVTSLVVLVLVAALVAYAPQVMVAAAVAFVVWVWARWRRWRNTIIIRVDDQSR